MKDPALADKLARSPATEWADILAGGAPSGFGKDTDWTLLNQTLDEMRQLEPRPDFLMIEGDFLAHRLDTRFKQNGLRGDPAFVDFAAKTLQAVAQQIQQRFPGVPIFPVLGNNDDSCGDYRGDDDDATLASSLPMARAMLGGDPGSGFQEDWSKLGSYDVPLPTDPAIHVIGLDDVFFSTHYQPCAGAADPSPDLTLLAWLRDRLAAARQAGTKVWLAMHIPPGVDVFGTITRQQCPAPPVTMWRDEDLQAFTALTDEFADVIAAQFAGHTHMAEFRLIGRQGFVLGVPAVSPIYLQNPAFERFTYRPDGALIDRETVAFSNFADVTKTYAAPPLWRIEDFASTWSANQIDFGSLSAVAHRLTDRPAASNPDLARYMLNYSTGHDGIWPAEHIDPNRAGRAAACSAANNSPAAFTACDCAG